MNLSEWLTVISLCVASVALGVAAYQTYLTKVALVRTEESLRLSTHVRQLELLDRMHYVISLQCSLDRWTSDLKSGLAEIDKALLSGDSGPLIHLSNSAIRSPANLVDRHFYENAPKWAVPLMMSGAAYFYSSACNFHHLWNQSKNEVDFGFAKTLKSRIDESISGIQKLNDLIDNALPEAILQTPASIDEEKYLGE